MKRNPWPYAITLYFVIFISAMVCWIGFAVRNDHELVRKDYYEHELKFQGELESLTRGGSAHVDVSYESREKILTIKLPARASGTVHFYRPSDARLDRKTALMGATSIDTRKFAPGLWKLRLVWIENGAEYRCDQTLVL